MKILQLTYDSSFIDFVKSTSTDDAATLEVNLSLLSSGNSYNEFTQESDSLPDQRDYLLPWTWENVPDHIRIWKLVDGKPVLIKDADGEKKQKIDLKITYKPVSTESQDVKNIKTYFQKSLEDQISDPKELIFAIKGSQPEEITIDESYINTQAVTEGKSQSVIAQMAQKLFPYNQDLGLLYLSVNKEIKEELILDFFSGEPEKTSFICFPVSLDKKSIWFHSDPKAPIQGNGFWSMQYDKKRKINEIEAECIAYTKETFLPKEDVLPGNIALHEKGKFQGHIPIQVEQDNDWKFNFTDILSTLLDIRKWVLQPEVLKQNKLEVEKYLYAPFTSIYFYRKEIEKLYVNSGLMKETNMEDKEKFSALIDSLTQNAQDLSGHLYEFQKLTPEKRMNLLNRILPYLPKVSEEHDEELLNLYDQLSDLPVQQYLISILCQFSYSYLALLGVDKGYKLVCEENIINYCENTIEGTVIESKNVIDIQGLEIYSLFNTYLVKNAFAKQDFPLVGHLLQEIDDFKPENLALKLTDAFDAVYNQNITDTKVFMVDGKEKEEVDFKLKIDKQQLHVFYKKEIEELTGSRKGPSSDQLPIRIQVGEPDRIFSKEDDLADELCGYVLLSTRSKERNKTTKFEPWKYHNWAKAQLSTEKTSLQSPFMIPSYLPEQDGAQRIFLEITNEEASLVATLKKTEGEDEVSVEEVSETVHPHIHYFLDGKSGNVEQNPYALKYGYYYKFAAYGVLNSGVLPGDLRIAADRINRFKIFKDDIPIVKNIENDKDVLLFLRTKAINAPYVKNNAKNFAQKFPGKLNPLCYELYPEDFENNGSDSQQKKKDLIIMGENFNQDIEFTVHKPKTSFWDCFSFVGLEGIEDFEYKVLNDEPKPEYDIEDYVDPCVADSFMVEIIDRRSRKKLLNAIYSYDYFKPASIQIKTKFLKTFKLIFDPAQQERIENNTIYLKEGGIYELKVYNMVHQKFFGGDEMRFNAELFITSDTEVQQGYYLLSPNVYMIETAVYEGSNKKIKPEDVWNRIDFTEAAIQKEDKQYVKTLLNVEEDKAAHFSIYSRVEVRHQKLDWMGRQPNIKLETIESSLNKAQDQAELLDAWWNSERPDNTSVISYAQLLASKTGNTNILHQFKNVIDNHAMLLKYSVSIFNRYECLGAPYNKDFIISSIPTEGTRNLWKRYLKKSKRTEPLPAPSIRFYIPLTNSIKETDEHDYDVADVMLVLDDVWYKEAGLAQKLTLGIRNAEFTPEKDKVAYYPEAGTDVTLSGSATKELNLASGNILMEEDYVILDEAYVKGPLGFTFDFGASNPRITSSSFIISGNGLTSYIGIKPDEKEAHWPMFKLAVKSEVLPKLHIDHASKEITDQLKSKWSSPQWVQFLKAVDALVPDAWRHEVKKNKEVRLSQGNIKKMIIESEEKFGATFSAMHNWYIILSTVESNIGGLPVEKYYNTYKIKEDVCPSVHNDQELDKFSGGYARIMLVRKSKGYDPDNPKEQIWQMLFGEKNEEKIKEDNVLSMPILTERIPVF